MLEAIARRVLGSFFGPTKAASTILNQANIAAAATTTLLNCDAVNLVSKPPQLALTVEGIYNAAAVAGIRVHVLSSPTNSATGTHTPAAPSATIMTDANAKFIVNRLIGLTINNTLDGSNGVITANTVNTVTVAALAGGAVNVWTQFDTYTIPGADYDTENWDTWTPVFAAGLAFRETNNYDADPMYLKVLIENLDVAQAVTLVIVKTVGGS